MARAKTEKDIVVLHGSAMRRVEAKRANISAQLKYKGLVGLQPRRRDLQKCLPGRIVNDLLCGAARTTNASNQLPLAHDQIKKILGFLRRGIIGRLEMAHPEPTHQFRTKCHAVKKMPTGLKADNRRTPR